MSFKIPMPTHWPITIPTATATQEGVVKLGGGLNGGLTALTFGPTVNTDASQGPVFTLAATGAFTLANPTNLTPGGTYMWLITNVNGAAALTPDTLFAWPSGAAPTLTAAAGSVDMITSVWDGIKLRSVFTGDVR